MAKHEHKLPKMLRGKFIRDGAATLTFDINASDIKKAKPKDPLRCAAALALKRACNAKAVCVTLTRTYVQRTTDMWERYLNPASLSREVAVIDRHGHFAPGSYHIIAPSPAQKLGARKTSQSKTKRKTRTKPRNEPAHYHTTVEVREIED